MGNYEFGDLNPRTPKQNIREITSETSGIKYIRDAGTNHNKKNIFESRGRMMAEVLKVYDDSADMKKHQSASGFNFWSLVDGPTDNTVVTIKANIPEIHHFPEPENLPPDPNSKSYNDDIKIIDMYPTFVAKKLGMAVPRVGQFVWVDFEDRINFAGGLYLGLVATRQLVNRPQQSGLRGAASPAGPKDSFEKKTPHHRRDVGNPLATSPVEVNSFITLEENTPWEENRVRAGVYGPLSRRSPSATDFGGVKVHKLFAVRLEAMSKAWVASGPGRDPFESSNGLRTPPESRYAWLQNPTSKRFKKFAKGKTSSKPHVKHNAENLKAALQRGGTSHYKLWEAMLLDEYGGDLKLGKDRRAWNSPHESGLAIDFNNNGLTPITKTKSRAKQRQTDAFKWLKENAYKYGINPYKKEEWHWECLIPRENFFSGIEFVSAPEPPEKRYNIRVVERSEKGRKLATSHKQYAKKQFA